MKTGAQGKRNRVKRVSGAFDAESTPDTPHTLHGKRKALEQWLAHWGTQGLAVALSGGADSALLAKIAHEVLGNHMLAVTVDGPFLPCADLARATSIARTEGIPHVVIALDALDVPGVAANPPNRCYLCKHSMLEAIAHEAQIRGFARVVDGGNVDDAADFRPGTRAVRELGVASPLAEAGFTKADVRALSRALELPTAELPAAACLASRVPYGEPLDRAILARVEQAEKFLRDLGFEQVRVRAHGAGALARIEVPDNRIAELAREPLRARVSDALHDEGFTYISVDLQGYRMGSLNEAL